MFQDIDAIRARVRESGLGHIEDQIVQLAKPAIHMTRTPTPDDNMAVGASKLGGLPDLPQGFSWPYRGEKPLTFIGQFNLAEIAPYDIEAILPKRGLLSFFFEADEVPWGEYDQRDGWHISYIEDANIGLVRTAHPVHQGAWGQIKPLPAHSLTFAQKWSLPLGDGPWEAAYDPQNSPMQYESYWDMWALAYPEPHHHLLGYPFPVQGNVIRECVVQSGQIKLGSQTQPQSYRDEQKAYISDQMQQWQFLFEIDSDASLDVMWGDMGTLYICIPRASLEARQFEDCWTIMQCA